VVEADAEGKGTPHPIFRGEKGTTERFSLKKLKHTKKLNVREMPRKPRDRLAGCAISADWE